MARRGAREKQVCHIRAGDQKHQPHDGHQDTERERKALAQLGKSPAAVVEPETRREDLLAESRLLHSSRDLLPHALENRLQACAGLRDRDPWIATTYDPEPGNAVPVPEPGRSHGPHRERRPDIGRLADRFAEEFGRCDSDDGEDHSFEGKCASDHARVLAETALPVAVADDGDRLPRRKSILVGTEGAPGGRRNP